MEAKRVKSRKTDTTLTDCEVVIMKVIWAKDYDIALTEILNDVNERYHKDWKPQTVSTFLTRLVKKEYLQMYRSGRTFLYHPLIGELDYGRIQIEKCADLWKNNDAYLFLSALHKQRKIRPEEAARIRELLDSPDVVEFEE